ncbi:cell division protein FtsQ/DivIB [Demequina sp. NBRC 110051]|uniref:cell division protein FtsQ/DivIB n=1 Tax=Demequina sp. NBRC 110051 TaxID=1570340 RepID=UPI000A06BA99|nr:cell division protein FtsQ/DivIB [Demequina sp. NBRC 110051]
MSDNRRPQPPSVPPRRPAAPQAPASRASATSAGATRAPGSTATTTRPASTATRTATPPTTRPKPGAARPKATTPRPTAATATPEAGWLRSWTRKVTRRSGAETNPTTASAIRKDVGDGTIATPWARVSARLRPDTVTQRLQERLRERRSADRRLFLIRWGTRAGIALAVLAGVWALLMSPLFAFDEGKVEATGYGTVVDPADVEAIVAPYEGESLAMVSTSHVEHQLTDLVGVASAQVEKVWPQGLRITLTPSEPVAAIPDAEEGYRLVNLAGEQVSASEEAPADLPVISIPVGEEHERILSGVLAVVDEIPADLRVRVEGIEAATEDSIHFTLRDGPAVEWGSGEDSATKAAVLGVLLESDKAEGADLIDVSAPTLPTVS